MKKWNKLLALLLALVMALGEVETMKEVKG